MKWGPILLDTHAITETRTQYVGSDLLHFALEIYRYFELVVPRYDYFDRNLRFNAACSAKAISAAPTAAAPAKTNTISQ